VLVHADRGDPAEAIRVLDLGAAQRPDLPHDRVPGHPEPASRPGHRRPAPHGGDPGRGCPGGEQRPRRDCLVLLGPGLDLAQWMFAGPDPLDPAQHHRPSGDRQIGHPARAPVLRRRDRPTPRARHQIRRGLDHQLKLTAGVGRGEDLEPVQPEQLSRHRLGSIRDHLGPSSILVVSSW